MYAIARSAGFDKQNASRGYALIVLVHELGRLLGTPVMTIVWTHVINRAGVLGAPFVLSAVSFFFPSLISC